MSLRLWLIASLTLPTFAGTPNDVRAHIDRHAPESVALLEQLVNTNSGSLNLKGVDAVAQVMEARLQSLGFEVERVNSSPDQRAPHLFGRLKGSKPGKPLLLIGHLDTVFEPSSPFQKFIRDGSRATGPGAVDMKGGLVVVLAALNGLRAAGLLETGSPIEIFLTADEESTAQPLARARQEFIEAGKRAKAALCFETGVRRGTLDYATTARRGYTEWQLRVTGTAGHSGQIFTEKLGHGAIFELSRILKRFHDEVREPNMTINAGMIVGGSAVTDGGEGSGSVSGKVNVVPAQALARGEFRALTMDQVARLKDKMYALAAQSLPGTKAELKFRDGYPPMSPTPGNRRLFAMLNEASRAAGLPALGELDPMERGAGDISVIAPFVDSLSGLGAIGSGAHAEGEWVDLDSIPRQAKRAAMLIHALTR